MLLLLVLVVLVARPAPATLHHLGQVGGLLTSLLNLGEVGVEVGEQQGQEEGRAAPPPRPPGCPC